MIAGFLAPFALLPSAANIFGGGITSLILVSAAIFFVGACLGSFANACALRLVRNEDFVHTKSRCRTCERPLKPWENLPVLGYLALRGRCLCRKASLPARYLIVEVTMGVIALAYTSVMPPVMALAFCIAATFIAISFLTDMDALALHPALLTILTIIGLGFAASAATGAYQWHITLQQSGAAILIGAGMPMMINSVFRLLRGKNGFGEGDFWLLAAIGAWIGPLWTVVVFFGAALIGAFAGIILILFGNASLGSKLPFGLFLSVVFIFCSNIYMLLN